MKITVVVERIPDAVVLYRVYNFIRHVVVAGTMGAKSSEYAELPKDSDVSGAEETGAFAGTPEFHNACVRHSDESRTGFRLILHFSGLQQDLWDGTAVCIDRFLELAAVIIAIETGGSVTVARAEPGESRQLTKRAFPAMLAEQLEQEFARTGDELDILELPRNRLYSITGAELRDAVATGRT